MPIAGAPHMVAEEDVRALINDPLCVLADEPTGNLDSHAAEKVLATMLELNKSLGTSLLVVTHDKQIASKMDKQLYLQDGCYSES